MTTVRLAMGGAAARLRNSLQYTPEPALLVSYAYFEMSFNCIRKDINFRDWVLDSGAFTAHASGKPVELAKYAEFCTGVLCGDNELTEIFSLDVIGDWKATLKNTEQLWSLGIPAIPTYHHGAPEEALNIITRDYPKIALGGAVGLHKNRKTEWAAQCMARVWPKPVHGFGFGSRETILSVPFHSVDATNWELGPSAFGNWQAFGKLDVRNSHANYRCEVEINLETERQAKVQWEEEMKLIAPDVQKYTDAMDAARGRPLDKIPRTEKRYKLGLIACGKSKLTSAAPAKDLYTGIFFKECKAWAERHCERWGILSAKHGILDPDKVVEPYDFTTKNMSKDEQRAWGRRIAPQVAKWSGGQKIAAVIGKSYRDALVDESVEYIGGGPKNGSLKTISKE